MPPHFWWVRGHNFAFFESQKEAGGAEGGGTLVHTLFIVFLPVPSVYLYLTVYSKGIKFRSENKDDAVAIFLLPIDIILEAALFLKSAFLASEREESMILFKIF